MNNNQILIDIYQRALDTHVELIAESQQSYERVLSYGWTDLADKVGKSLNRSMLAIVVYKRRIKELKA